MRRGQPIENVVRHEPSLPDRSCHSGSPFACFRHTVANFRLLILLAIHTLNDGRGVDTC